MDTAAGGPGKPRILYLITDPISTRLLRGQLAYLREHGWDVELASAPGAELHAFGESEGVVVHELPFVREPSPLKDLKALVATVQLIRRRRPQVVNASTPKAGLLGMLAAFVCRVPVRVYVVRGLRFETLTGRRRTVFELLERLAVRCSTQTVFNSRSLRSLAESEGIIPAGRGIVLGAGSGNGVDVERFADLPDPAVVRAELGLPDGRLRHRVRRAPGARQGLRRPARGVRTGGRGARRPAAVGGGGVRSGRSRSTTPRGPGWPPMSASCTPGGWPTRLACTRPWTCWPSPPTARVCPTARSRPRPPACRWWGTPPRARSTPCSTATSNGLVRLGDVQALATTLLAAAESPFAGSISSSWVRDRFDQRQLHSTLREHLWLWQGVVDRDFGERILRSREDPS